MLRHIMIACVVTVSLAASVVASTNSAYAQHASSAVGPIIFVDSNRTV